MKFRTLKAEEIDVRVQQVTEKGAILLLYKDARADMNLLDEAGVKWKREHQLINNNLFCTVSIWDNDIKEWVSRQDVGTESMTEKEKGQASDSFKRACFNWGIGRELYTAPFVWVDSKHISTYKNKAGKLATYDKFEIEAIEYTDGTITALAIQNSKTKTRVFGWRSK